MFKYLFLLLIICWVFGPVSPKATDGLGVPWGSDKPLAETSITTEMELLLKILKKVDALEKSCDEKDDEDEDSSSSGGGGVRRTLAEESRRVLVEEMESHRRLLMEDNRRVLAEELETQRRFLQEETRRTLDEVKADNRRTLAEIKADVERRVLQFTDSITQLSETIGTYFDNMRDNVEGKFIEVGQNVVEVRQSINSFAGNVSQDMYDQAESFADRLDQMGSDVYTKMDDSVQSMYAGAQEIKDGVVDKFTTAQSQVKSLINAAFLGLMIMCGSFFGGILLVFFLRFFILTYCCGTRRSPCGRCFSWAGGKIDGLTGGRISACCGGFWGACWGATCGRFCRPLCGCCGPSRGTSPGEVLGVPKIQFKIERMVAVHPSPSGTGNIAGKGEQEFIWIVSPYTPEPATEIPEATTVRGPSSQGGEGTSLLESQRTRADGFGKGRFSKNSFNQ